MLKIVRRTRMLRRQRIKPQTIPGMLRSLKL
jgi:hypothetical protein